MNFLIPPWWGDLSPEPKIPSADSMWRIIMISMPQKSDNASYFLRENTAACG